MKKLVLAGTLGAALLGAFLVTRPVKAAQIYNPCFTQDAAGCVPARIETVSGPPYVIVRAGPRTQARLAQICQVPANCRFQVVNVPVDGQ